MSNKIKYIKGIDPAGQVFLAEGKVFRGINDNFIDEYLQIYKICSEKGLLGKYIIATEITDVPENNSFKLIFEHEKVNPLTIACEWSTFMLSDAGNFVIDLMLELNRLRLGLKDAHSLNIAFYKGKFIWLDFCSIIKGKTRYGAVKEVIECFLNPCILHKKGQHHTPRSMFSMPIKLEDISGYLNPFEYIIYRFFELIVKFLALIRLVTPGLFALKFWFNLYGFKTTRSKWKNYHNDMLKILDNKEKWPSKLKDIIAFIIEKQPDRILDIGGNAGWYGFALDKHGIKSIIADIDYGAIDKTYIKLKKNKVQNITPVILNFLSPTPSFFNNSPCGDDGCIEHTFLPATKRLKSDIVISIALVHHLIFFQQVNFIEIIKQFKSFTNKYLIIEFVPPEDKHIQHWNKPGFCWYTYDNFKSELEKEFKIIDIKNYKENQRTIFFTEVKTGENE